MLNNLFKYYELLFKIKDLKNKIIEIIFHEFINFQDSCCF